MKRSSVRVVLSAIALLVISSITFGSFASASSSSGVISLSASTYNVSSLAGLIVVPVNRTAGTTGAVSVQYTTLQGSASYATDYSGEHGVLNWKSGDATPKSIIVKIYDAGPVSVKKLFSLKLSSPVGASLGTASATVTITESSASSSTVSLSASSYAVPRASGELTVAVARVGNVGSAGAVSFQTKEGSAVYGVDYGGIHGVLTWGAGDATPKSFKVHIDAPVATGNRSFAVELLSPSGVSLGSPSSATVTILGTQSAGSVPSAPSGVAANSGNALVSLTWSASSGATSYHVKRATTSGGPYSQVSAPTTLTYRDTAVTDGTRYFYVVSALDSAGESANSSQVSALPVVSSPSASACNLASPAFCDTFDEGPTSAPGREGDLDSTKWSVAHLAAADIGEGQVSNPVYPAPIPACKASFSSTSVYPPYDTLICDPSGTRGSQLLTAVASQNYGVNSYMIRQPFDFSGRTGKIDFDVGDDSGYQLVGGFPEINITQNPVAAPTYQQYQNYDTGPVPQNAIIVNFSQGGPCSPTQASPVLVMVYNDYAPTMLPSSNTIGCVNISPGAMNHYEIQLSQNTIEIYGTDYSTDNGQTFTNLHKLYSASISLPFSRGYVHINARNHATIKYGYGPDAIFHWDNIGFDGPVIANTQSYEIPDNTTMESYQGPAGFGTYTVMNLGYQLQDGTAGKPAGIYDPTNILPPLQFKNINTSGATSALLSFNAYLDILQNPADTTWGWKYRFNGGAWMTRTLTSLEVEAINNVFTFDGHGSSGNISMLVNVPIGNLIDGTNTFEMLPLNVPMGYPPVIANIDLTLTH